MIKQVFLFAFIFIGALLLAFASVSLVLDRYIFNQSMSQLDSSALTNEFLMKFAINNVEQLDNQNYGDIYQYSCFIISRPDTFINSLAYKDAPLKQQELLDLKAKAEILEKKLRERGLCK